MAGDCGVHPAKRDRLQTASGRATASRQGGAAGKKQGRNSFTRTLFSLSECDKRTRPATGNLHRRPRLRGLYQQRNRTRQFSRQKRRHGRDCQRETCKKNNSKRKPMGQWAMYMFIRSQKLLEGVWGIFQDKSIQIYKNRYERLR